MLLESVYFVLDEIHAFSVFEDSEPAYTQKELAEFENHKVTYNGEKMTEYDDSQQHDGMANL